MLTRWIDRLLPFDFDIKNLAGSLIIFRDIRKPQPLAYWDEHFGVALIDVFITCLEFQASTSSNLKMDSNPDGISRHAIAQPERERFGFKFACNANKAHC